jgi:hypothetical protein
MLNVASTKDKITERRLDRMRLGQAVCEYVALLSDPEIRLAIVPLTEAEYHQALEAIAAMPGVDNLANASLKDRRLSQEIILRSIREEDDLTERTFSDIDEMMETLEVADVDEIVDRYNEMMEKSSPSLDGIPEQELEEIKKALQTMDWSALSGRAWYALKRFLSEIMPLPLLGNSPGSGLTNSVTTTSD